MVATPSLAAPFLRAPLHLASLLAGRPALIVLTYHRVLPAPDPMLTAEPDAGLFEAQMTFLARYMVVLPLVEALRRLEAGTLPRRAIAITFDDGYANNAQVALPILRRLGLPATFFIATGYLDGGCMWNDAVIETLRRCPGGGTACTT
jgi:peptidoglycan/xylan/chitin deacetylase (PgdA/CDA1 family)